MTPQATRQLADQLRTDPLGNTAPTLFAAAAAIDALLDVIELQRGPHPVMPGDGEPLRELRAWHCILALRCKAAGTSQYERHCNFVATLNRYFPANDQSEV